MKKIFHILCVWVSYFVAAKIGLLFALFHTSITPLWPPSGIGLAALFLVGRWVWPGIFLGSLTANYSTGLPLLVSAGIGAGSTLGAYIGASLLRRFKFFQANVFQINDLFVFYLLGVMIGPLFSASIGVTSLWSGGLVAKVDSARAWAAWWAGDATGILVIVPLVVVFNSLHWRRPSWTQVAEAVLLVGAFALCISYGVATSELMTFLVFPFVVWGAVRFQHLGVVTLVFVLTCISIPWLVHKNGFHSHVSDVSVLEMVYLLQFELATASLTGMILATSIFLRKESETHQKEMKQFLLDSQRTALVGSWALELPSLKLNWTDQSFYNFGIPVGKSAPTFDAFFSLLHPDDQVPMREWIQACRQGKNPGRLEFRTKRSDGTFRILEGMGTLFRDKNNKPIRMIGTNRDITDLKNIELELRKSESQLRAIIASEPECVKLLGPNGEVIEMNPAGLAMLEANSVEELQKHPLINFIVREYREAFVELHRRVMRGESGMLEFEVTGLLGTRRWLETHATPIQGIGDHAILLLGVTRDITQHKKAEAALVTAKNLAEDVAKKRAKFIDVAAHELRTPITALSLLVQIVQKQLDQGQPVTAATLAKLRRPVERLVRLVNDLLDVSRLERNLMTLSPVTSNIVAIISNCIEEFQLQAPLRRFVFIPPKKNIEAVFDPVRINQVISNLLDNAIKYSDEESPIEVKAEVESNGTKISVIDQGPGIPKEQLEGIFTAFTRGSSDATIRSSGLGLGLDISRRIVELHGGVMGAWSEPGYGSIFYFLIPSKPASI